MLLWSVFIILNQLIFAVIFFVAWVTLTFTLLPKAGEAIMRDQLKHVEEVDLSAPLRIRDFLAWKGWIKLASIYGFRKTMCLYCLFMMGVGGAIFFTSNIFGMISILWAAGCTILVGIVSIIIFYRQIGKASK